MGAQLETWQVWVQVGSPVIALLATVTALGIAVVGTRERARDRLRQQEAEARLFRVPRVGIMASGETGSDRYRGIPQFRWTLANYGPHAVAGVVCEAWMWSRTDPLKVERPTWKADLPVLPSGQPTDAATEYGGVSEGLGRKLLTWRVRWTDRYGNRWVTNGRDAMQDNPHHYKEGEAPPWHPGVSPGS